MGSESSLSTLSSRQPPSGLCGSPFQLSLRSRAGLYGVCVLVRVPCWPPSGAFPTGLCSAPGLNEDGGGGGKERCILNNQEQRENVRLKES